MIGINSNDKRLYVNKSGAMMLIKKSENIKKNDNSVTSTLSNQKTFINNYNISKKNNASIYSSFRQNNVLCTSKLQNTISFGNNILSKSNMSGLYNAKKSSNKKENINTFSNNNVLTSTNINLL